MRKQCIYSLLFFCLANMYSLCMQNMYDDGDEDMKKTISDAWTTYRSTYKPGFKKPISSKKQKKCLAEKQSYGKNIQQKFQRLLSFYLKDQEFQNFAEFCLTKAWCSLKEYFIGSFVHGKDQRKCFLSFIPWELFRISISNSCISCFGSTQDLLIYSSFMLLKDGLYHCFMFV